MELASRALASFPMSHCPSRDAHCLRVTTRRSSPLLVGSNQSVSTSAVPGNFTGDRVSTFRCAGVRPDGCFSRDPFRAHFIHGALMNVFVRRQGWAAAALAVSLLTTRASAQALPDAKELIAKYNRAVGGEVWKSHK